MRVIKNGKMLKKCPVSGYRSARKPAPAQKGVLGILAVRSIVQLPLSGRFFRSKLPIKEAGRFCLLKAESPRYPYRMGFAPI
jgi:hypothetical protein